MKNKLSLAIIFVLISMFVGGCTSKGLDSSSALVLEDDEELSYEAAGFERPNLVEEKSLDFCVIGDVLNYKGIDYKIEEVDGGNRSGSRNSNVAVDIGFGDRIYWGLTNEYGQLVYVLAENIIVQNDDTEPVNEEGRYYNYEANVPGTEHKDLDQGHIIADSLGGVANAYNITPQQSTLNRYGDQVYMEKGIRNAGGCTNFTAEIFYADNTTQIPSSYKYVYTLLGNEIVDEFPNVNPDDYNKNINQPVSKPVSGDNTGTYVVNGKNGKIHIKGECNATIEGSKSFMNEPIAFRTYEEAEAKSIEIEPGLEKRKCGNCW